MNRFHPRGIALAILLLSLGCTAGKRIVLSPAELITLGEQRLEKGKRIKAREVLEQCRRDFPASPEASHAQILIADSFFQQERYEEAAVEYRLFLDFHPASRKAPYALYQLGLCRSEQNLGPNRDMTTVHQAIEEMEKLVRLYPESEYAPRGEEALRELRLVELQHDLVVARFYLKTHRWSGAILRYERVLTRTEDPEIRSEAEAGIARALPHKEEQDQKRAEWEAERAEQLAREAEEEDAASEDE